ncbi:uncharacterized protein KD926_010688 [Aspergillus affinis]|uniref:uncharacterized protein n=1 Tax=Aspergillus affinis TaxID=1070780 RepID=UPI0022FF08DA|nr:uncharacterized protein KD926_010688 [Aspergillus affinis]KAI9038559.1 hypothetical protein KD926_010688 [Aspergillus affinis]
MSPTSSFKILISLALALTTTTASTLTTVQFTSYAALNCASAPVGSARVVSTYCVNIEDFPIRSFRASVDESSSSCEVGQTVVLRLFGEAGCDGDWGVLEEVELGTKGESEGEGECFGFEGTVRSLSVVCV